MITAVLDANTLASGVAGFRSDTSTPGALLRSWNAGMFTLITSEHVLEETRRTLRKSYFIAHVNATLSARLLALFRYRSVLTPITTPVEGIATHPEDDLVLASALSANAEYLVTGDTKLQQLESYQEVRIVSPAAFLRILTTQE